MPIPITLLPSLPSEGWLSMNRYWEAIAGCAEKNPGSDFQFLCPLKRQGVRTRRAGKLKLAYEKGLAYPIKIRLQTRTGIAHVLDHSYAFLLGSVPQGVKTIVTVHDLLPLREPDGLSEKALARFRARVEWVKKADVILSDSIATRDDLIELIGADGGKIRVLPLGADLPKIGERTEKLPPEVSGRFLFSIGGYMKRKNLEILPRMLESVRRSNPSVTLVRAGARLPEPLVKEFARRCGEGALVELGVVSDDLLSALYQSAAATVIPSRYEGFGLPVLEAMARGCPVISARTTSLPEVGGDAAFYFEVDDPEDAAGKALQILNADPVGLGIVKERGIERARNFTWDIHFNNLLEIYRDVIGIAGPRS